MMINPFPTANYVGPDYFCDREEEVRTLKNNIDSGNSTILVALRRLGKTALIRHLFHQTSSRYIAIYMDILATESLSDFLNKFITSVAEAIPEQSAFGKRFWHLIKSLRPAITYDSLQGTPVITVRTTPDESKRTLTDVFMLLEQQKKPVIIAIDEFQQILDYPEERTDAWMRSVIQQLSNVRFIFSGSQQHLLQDLFASPSKPFFRSALFLKLSKINHDTYAAFIADTLTSHSRRTDPDTILEILDWTDTYTYYVQLLCNRIYSSGVKKIDSSVWKAEAQKLLREQEFVFFNYREMLTKSQWNLLKAIAAADPVYQPTASDFINEYDLGNPSTTRQSLQALKKMELVYQDTDAEGKNFYGVYDILFRRWITR